MNNKNRDITYGTSLIYRFFDILEKRYSREGLQALQASMKKPEFFEYIQKRGLTEQEYLDQQIMQIFLRDVAFCISDCAKRDFLNTFSRKFLEKSETFCLKMGENVIREGRMHFKDLSKGIEKALEETVKERNALRKAKQEAIELEREINEKQIRSLDIGGILDYMRNNRKQLRDSGVSQTLDDMFAKEARRLTNAFSRDKATETFNAFYSAVLKNNDLLAKYHSEAIKSFIVDYILDEKDLRHDKPFNLPNLNESSWRWNNAPHASEAQNIDVDDFLGFIRRNYNDKNAIRAYNEEVTRGMQNSNIQEKTNTVLQKFCDAATSHPSLLASHNLNGAKTILQSHLANALKGRVVDLDGMIGDLCQPPRVPAAEARVYRQATGLEYSHKYFPKESANPKVAQKMHTFNRAFNDSAAARSLGNLTKNDIDENKLEEIRRNAMKGLGSSNLTYNEKESLCVMLCNVLDFAKANPSFLGKLSGKEGEARTKKQLENQHQLKALVQDYAMEILAHQTQPPSVEDISKRLALPRFVGLGI